MPYFVFRINNHREYRCLEQYDDYRSARHAVRAFRQSDEAASVVEYRLVFADDAAHGESLLRTPRERILREDD